MAEAEAIDPALDGFSAPELAARGGDTILLATPTAGGIYKGCIAYAIDLATATVVDGDGDGQPDPMFVVEGATPVSRRVRLPRRRAAKWCHLWRGSLGQTPTFRLFESGVR